MRIPTQRAFTVVEIITILAILGMLAAVTITALGSWRRQQAANSIKSDLHQATSGLKDYKNFNQYYPPNLAGTGFAASPKVALLLQTNSPSVGVYKELNDEQNAQLFLNTCNANLFLTPHNITCEFEGNKTGAKIHVKGTNSANTIWISPVAQQSLIIDCDNDQTACDLAIETIVAQFVAQGGEFPIFVPDKNVPLPEPTLVPNGPANRYCLEGRATDYPDISYHTSSDDGSITIGECPSDPELHYYQ